MNYYSTNKKAPISSFQNAVVKGLAPDKGLYFPESIEPLPKEFFDKIEEKSNHEIAQIALQQFVGDDIPKDDFNQLIEEVLNFDFPTVEIEKGIYSLELFHGPTLAFKDVGARFMARCLGHFNKGKEQQITVLVATSGDTGGAVASGFLGVKGVDVVILYPSGKVSDIQEKQLTTLGENIRALEVDGTFDDCQKIVKTAFLDDELNSKIQLTSANSINVARFLPQMLYYFFAYKNLKSLEKELVFSVPSGNYGNITGGLFALKLGLPVKQFVASSNANDIVPNYLKTGTYSPKPSIATISNAMDVGDPSNFVRITELFEHNFDGLKKVLSGFSYSDEETKRTMKRVWEETSYLLDPHGAVGYMGLKDYIKEKDSFVGVFLETAHPIKFIDVVEDATESKIEIPRAIQELQKKEKRSILISKDYLSFKNYMLQEHLTLLSNK